MKATLTAKESDNESTIEHEKEINWSDEFDTLRWAVFGDLSKKRAYKLLPFHGHIIVSKLATEPLCHNHVFESKALCCIETLTTKDRSQPLLCVVLTHGLVGRILC
jgi:hypothetical protein